MTSTIQAIVFDYGNVLARFSVPAFLNSLSVYTKLGVEQLKGIMKRSSDLIRSYESGDVTSEEFYEELKERCALTATMSEFIDAYVNIFTPIESTIALVRTLQPGYRLGLLSNTSEWHFEYEIRRNEAFPLFEAVTVSHLVRARKPSEKIYQDVLRKLALPPQVCVYIDDIEEYALAATALGMTGIHYTDHASLVQKLAESGVKCNP